MEISLSCLSLATVLPACCRYEWREWLYFLFSESVRHRSFRTIHHIFFHVLVNRRRV